MGIIIKPSRDDSYSSLETFACDLVSTKGPIARRGRLVGVYGALLVFIFIYCARPEDWISGLSSVPLAKIAGIFAVVAFVFSLRHVHQRFPQEIFYLGLLIGQMFLAAALSPVWKGGAFEITLDFAKVLILVVVLIVAVNTKDRLRLLLLIQAGSVAAIALVAVWKGRLLAGRLEGVLNGVYTNPNEMALAIVISLPLCLALLFLTKSVIWKAAWALAILVMTYAVFLTGSRGGFISLCVAGAVCLWEFGIRGRRRYLISLTILLGMFLWYSSSGMLGARLKGTFDPQENIASAYGSSQQRQELFWRSIELTKEHPLFGVGPGNFQVISGSWHVTHNTFTEVSSEGGVPAFILFLLILGSGFKNLRAIKRLGAGQGESRLLGRALRASLTAFVVGAVFTSAAYQFFPYFLVAYTSALFRITTKMASNPFVNGYAVTEVSVKEGVDAYEKASCLASMRPESV